MWQLKTLSFHCVHSAFSSRHMESLRVGLSAIDWVRACERLFMSHAESLLAFGPHCSPASTVVIYGWAFVDLRSYSRVVLIHEADPRFFRWLRVVFVKAVGTVAPSSPCWFRMLGLEAWECVLNKLSQGTQLILPVNNSWCHLLFRAWAGSVGERWLAS